MQVRMPTGGRPQGWVEGTSPSQGKRFKEEKKLKGGEKRTVLKGRRVAGCPSVAVGVSQSQQGGEQQV